VLPEALIVRTSAFFGPADDHNFLTVVLRALAERRVFSAASDVIVSPTYVPDLAHATLDLLMDHEEGIWHLANPGEITWFDFARAAAEQAGMDPSLIRPVPLSALALVAPRPAYTALGSVRGPVLPGLESAITRYIGATRTRRTQSQLG
jgi:dTDP-4-dehydrorhamnose reductase